MRTHIASNSFNKFLRVLTALENLNQLFCFCVVSGWALTTNYVILQDNTYDTNRATKLIT